MKRLPLVMTALLALLASCAPDDDATPHVLQHAVKVHDVKISPETVSLGIGESVRFVALATDSNGNPFSSLKVSWSSKDKNILDVDASGLATGKSHGVTRVYAKVHGNDAEARVAVGDKSGCGDLLASYDGVNAYSNGPDTGTPESCAGQDPVTGEWRYQCVGLVKRYWSEQGWPTWAMGDGVPAHNKPTSADVDLYYNGDAEHPPIPGDILEMSNGKTSHIALVTASCEDGIDIIEQNWPDLKGTATLPYNCRTVGSRGGGWKVVWWARAKANMPSQVHPCLGNGGTVVVDAKSDIFLAGLGTVPTGFPGGAGLLPPSVAVNGGDTIVLNATGTISCCSGSATSGPDGGPAGSGASFISGYGNVAAFSNPVAFPLVGVFGGPTVSTPWPIVVIGAGKALSVPTGATELYLGLPDAVGFNSVPGYYDDNIGSFTVTYSIAPSP